jgi:hypothetical protein
MDVSKGTTHGEYEVTSVKRPSESKNAFAKGYTRGVLTRASVKQQGSLAGLLWKSAASC